MWRLEGVRMSEIRPKDMKWELDEGWVNPKKNLFCNDLECNICNGFKAFQVIINE